METHGVAHAATVPAPQPQRNPAMPFSAVNAELADKSAETPAGGQPDTRIQQVAAMDRLQPAAEQALPSHLIAAVQL